MENFYEFDYNGKRYFFRKYPEDKYKNIVFCCAKNEDAYIREWIEHYLKLGFDKVIIVDNNQEAGRLEDKIEDFVSRGNVQIFSLNGVEGMFQNSIYTMFMNYGNYKWCAYFDCDEFLEISDSYSNIDELFNTINEDILMVHWIVYGANGAIAKDIDKPTQERFKLPMMPISLFKENMYLKAIVRGGRKGYFESPHVVKFTDSESNSYNIGGYYITDTLDANVSFPIRVKKCFLKHYITKSFTEYNEKLSRKRIAPSVDSIGDFFVTYENNEIPLRFYSQRFFFGNELPWIDEPLKNYEMIVFMGNKNDPMLQFHYPAYAMSKCSNKVIVVDKDIDDTFFATLLEIAKRTGNTLIAAENDAANLWNIFIKTCKGKGETYYIYGAK